MQGTAGVCPCERLLGTRSLWPVHSTATPGGRVIAQGHPVASCPEGSPVSDLADLLPDLLAPVGDEEGHPRCRLALPERGPVYSEVLVLPGS